VTEPTPDTADNARTDQRDPTVDRATVTIAATAETVWDMVADVTRMGEWSPECYACRWIGKRRGPVAGARFAGFNKRGRARWVTTNEVVEAERGRAFVFRTRETGVRWSYRFEPSADGAGTTLTETRDTSGARAWLVRMAGPFVGGADSHADELRAGMRRTLERVKAAAEATR
jgi:dimethylaniline monooxygenase (N-oxide forming)